MDKIYIDYDNTDILDLPLDESNVIRCSIVGIGDEIIEERSKDLVGTEKAKKKSCPVSVYVGSEEGPIPHVHIFLKKFNGSEKAWKTEAVVLMLLANAYFDHSEGNKFFEEKKQFDAVIRLFEVIKENGMSGWEYACDLWNKHNPDYRIPTETIEQGMPDYSWEPHTYEEYKKMRKSK